MAVGIAGGVPASNRKGCHLFGCEPPVINDLLFAIATDDRMLRRNLEESLAGDGIVVESFSCELDPLRAMREA